MSSRIASYTLACAMLIAPAASAQTADQQPQRATTVQIATATRLPGITLQPGAYVFKLGTPTATQNIVEVWSTDGSKKVGSFLTVDYTQPMRADAVVLYPNTNPPTLRAWYFPGETVGRAFVYTENEAQTVSTAASSPVLYASWNPDNNLPIGTVRVETYGETRTEDLADVAAAVGDATVDAAQAVGDKVEDVWDNVSDNASLQNPTDARKAAERQLDAAEETYDDLEDHLSDEQEIPLKAFRGHLEKLEDTFEDNDQTWMTHYTAAMAALDALAPERPVGTSGGTVTLDAATLASLGTIRTQLRAFHEAAMR